jgi:dihydroxyacid dehydratase/phosphogluconate dehydratase
MYKGAEYADDDIRHKPYIGVANTLTDVSPATAHLGMLADAVKQGVWSAGGVPFEFGVPGLYGNIAVAHENCRYELVERDVVCVSIEVVSKINWLEPFTRRTADRPAKGRPCSPGRGMTGLARAFD